MNIQTTIKCTLILLVCSVSLAAQNSMRIHYKDGKTQDVPISLLDSVTFVKQTAPDEEATMVSTWFWGSKEAGYYELITFYEDHTYVGLDNYFSVGYTTQTYGWYTQYGSMLSLQSNGFGYSRRYNWFITGLSDNALEVMTKMGPFTYFKLQPETLHVSRSEPYTGFAENDSIVFTDDVVVRAEGNKLYGIGPGSTYVLINVASQNKIVAYEVTVN